MEKELNFIKEVSDFCNNSAEVIQSSFGPNGLDCMVSKISGTLLVTNKGFDVLKSLSYKSPYGRLVFKGLEEFYNHSGDFSKKFILILRELLSEALKFIECEERISAQQKILCVGQGMKILLAKIIPEVHNELIHICINTDTSSPEFIERNIIGVMRASINGKFGPQTCNKLIHLLRTLLFENKSEITAEFVSRVEKIVDHFSEIFFEVPGFSFSSSTILHGILIPREFATMLQRLPKTSTDTSFKFILLGTSLGYGMPQSRTVLEIKDVHKTGVWLGWRAKYIEDVMQKFSRAGIGLVISSQALPEIVVHFCNQYQIAAIQLVPKEDMRRLCSIFKIFAMSDIENDLTPFIGNASCCKPVQVGQHTYTYLEPNEMDDRQVLLAKQVLVYGPNEPMCKQYSVALQNVLKNVKNIFMEKDDGKQSISVIPGGGVVEVCLALALERQRMENNMEANMQKACYILEKALLAIPRQLLQNTGKVLSICHYTAQMKEAILSGNMVPGINKNGALCDLSKDGLLEPLSTNIQLVSSVIQLFIQIAQTDKIIHVKGLPRTTNSTSNRDLDSQYEDSD